MERDGITVRELAESGVAIAGGTSGVGLASARRLAEAGVPRLVLMGRDARRGAAACAAVRAVAPDAAVDYVAVDAGDPAAAARAVEEATARLGTLDVLVNSTVSLAQPSLLVDLALEDLAPTLTDLALPPMLMTRAALPAMRAQRGGCIVNVASDAAKVATVGESVIGAAMAAIVMFTRAAAMEAKRDGVRVNVLTPSLIGDTPAGRRALESPFGSRIFEKAKAMAHLGVVEADDMAALVLYLASPAAAKLTGQAISLNGGISAA
ncbi:MAG TPA: SDR family oxidoreductase [Baekduia sp.]|uniref:SDR family NAD(P)-dependent oxidoreductase n=1 Tax=Baekduia sp. TaxID=2600305 RepID=UPI002D7987A7|nr:SDR family oxidoreductase [Baekduia sp.]HET6507883.1 SDR family oxidoreductase [Baekduia sp.]